MCQSAEQARLIVAALNHAAPAPLEAAASPPAGEPLVWMFREVGKPWALALRELDLSMLPGKWEQVPLYAAPEPYAWGTPGGDVSRSRLWCEQRCLTGSGPFPLFRAPSAAPPEAAPPETATVEYVIPLVPTPQMLDALDHAMPGQYKIGRQEARKIWDAVVRAAPFHAIPAPPSAQQAPPPTGWMPIESAPKPTPEQQTIEMLIWCRAYGVCQIEWYGDLTGYWKEQGVTHWMPLPPPPKQVKPE